MNLLVGVSIAVLVLLGSLRVWEHEAKIFGPPPSPPLPPLPPLPRDITTYYKNEYEQTHNQQHV